MPANPKVRVEITAVDRATAAIKGVSNQISNISSSLMKLGAAYAMVRVGFAAFEQLTSKVAEYGEQLLIGAQRTGMTTEQIAGLGLMAKQKGIEFDAFIKTLGIFSRNLVGMGGKGKDAERVLGALGIASRDAAGQILPMHGLLLSVADHFGKMKDGAEKAAAAQALFGRGGAQLIPLLNEGAAGIQEVERRAAELGITLDEKSARAAHEFGDQMVILGELIHGVTLKIGMAMIPTLLEWTVEIEKSGILLQKWAYGIGATTMALAALGGALSGQFKAAGKAWEWAKLLADAAEAKEEEYHAAVSKGTGEVDRRIKTLKALGDVPEFTAPKEDKDAKRRLDEIKKTIAAMVEQAAAFDQAKADMEIYRLQKLGASAAELEFARAVAASILQLEAQKKSADEVRGILGDLTEQVIAFGQSESAILLYRLEKAGATATELEFARAVLASLDALRAQKEGFDKVNEAAKAHKEGLDSLGKSLRESLETPAEKATVKFRELTQLLGTGRISAEEFSKATRKMQAELEGAGAMGRQFGKEMGDAFAQMIVYGRGGIQMLQSLLEMIVANILKALVFKAIWKELGGEEGEEAGGVKGFLAGVFGGLAGKQHGGPVFSGMPYLVGERGPELFVPGVAGTVVSNRHIGGDTFIVENHIDARGADPSVEGRLRRVLREVHRSAVKTAAFQVRENALRSGR